MGKTARFIYIPQSVMRLGAICIGKSKLYEQLFESLEVDTRKAKDLLDAAGAKIIGAILNKASLDNTSDYYYYYGKDKQ